MSAAPKTSVPPPDMARGATADLCDVHYPDPVDVVVEPKVQIMAPGFKCVLCAHGDEASLLPTTTQHHFHSAGIWVAISGSPARLRR